jgi:hypothetical protein
MTPFVLICCLCGLLAMGSSRVFQGLTDVLSGHGRSGWHAGSTHGVRGDRLAAPIPVVSVEARPAEEEIFCLCNECEMGPACSMRFPDCVRSPQSGGPDGDRPLAKIN